VIWHHRGAPVKSLKGPTKPRNFYTLAFLHDLQRNADSHDRDDVLPNKRTEKSLTKWTVRYLVRAGTYKLTESTSVEGYLSLKTRQDQSEIEICIHCLA
jgi:hypothetical protein